MQLSRRFIASDEYASVHFLNGIYYVCVLGGVQVERSLAIATTTLNTLNACMKYGNKKGTLAFTRVLQCAHENESDGNVLKHQNANFTAPHG